MVQKASTPLEKKESQNTNVRVKRPTFKKCLIDDSDGPLIPYEILVAIRILLTLIPQIGYIHPDEYFQSVEIVNSKLRCILPKSFT